MEILFVLVPVFIGVVFVGVFGFIAFTIFKGLTEWADNNGKPVESVEARVVTKRTDVSGSSSMNHGGSTSTYYYCTFELPDGDRREFSVKGKDFGQLVEGDDGQLTYQGTRYHGFSRERR